MKITLEQYLGIHSGSATDVQISNAKILLSRVDTLLLRAERAGVILPPNPVLHCNIAGSGLGGFRPQNCAIGAPNSAHKQGQAVDVYDPDGELDDLLMHNQNWLVELGLYLEHPSSTRGWSHLSTRAPKSGSRVFYP